jgi:hypothetical protein
MAAAEMDDLAERFANRGVSSVFIYTREAHPGENYRHHTSMEDKRAHARVFVTHSNVRRRILVDELGGTAHRAYGMLPNMTFIVARNKLLYKASWTEAPDVESALVDLLQRLPRQREDKLRPIYTERVAWRPDRDEGFRTGLGRAGPQAVKDFYGKKP